MSARTATLLITPRTFGRHDPSLVEAARAACAEVLLHPGLDPADPGAADLLARADGWIAGLERIDAAVLEAAPRLRVIARYGVGVESVDLEAAARRGVAVTNTPGANAEAVAELTIGLLIALARSIPAASAQVHAGEWPRVEGIGIAGRTLGLVGIGAIGSAVVPRAAGLGLRVLATDPGLDAAAIAAAGAEPVERAELLARSDFVSLHLPVLPATRGLVDEAFLAAMKPGAFLINAARGELVDEDALEEALRSGRLAGAALDALGQEPPRPGNPLLSIETVIATPHIGAHTDTATNEMGRMALADALAVLDGRAPHHPVVPVPAGVSA